MIMTLGQLRQVIVETFRKTRVIDTSSKKADDHLPVTGSVERASTARQEELDDQIEELRDMPEFSDLNEFMNSKLDDDDLSFNFIELQALARNAASDRIGKRVEQASQSDTQKVRHELETVGFKFINREPPRNVRGATSNPNGTSPFAGMAGGTGIGSDMSGPSFASFGGGPGAIGAGVPWDANDSKNLRMSPKRR